jgi:hypothetical protein
MERSWRSKGYLLKCNIELFVCKLRQRGNVYVRSMAARQVALATSLCVQASADRSRIGVLMATSYIVPLLWFSFLVIGTDQDLYAAVILRLLAK